MTTAKKPVGPKKLSGLDRHQDERGVWRYIDPQSALFVVEMERHGIPMEGIDNFIERLHKDRDGNLFVLREVERAQLLEEREEALQAYVAGNFGEAKALAKALWRACARIGLHAAAVRLARKGEPFFKGRRIGGFGPLRVYLEDAVKRAGNRDWDAVLARIKADVRDDAARRVQEVEEDRSRVWFAFDLYKPRSFKTIKNTLAKIPDPAIPGNAKQG